jgi:hypothetical protein
MRRLTLCVVVCLLPFGALAQARVLPSNSSSRSTVQHKSAHTSKPHKKAKKHPKKQLATLLSTTTAKTSAVASTGGSTTLFGDSTVESGLDSNSAGWAESFPVTSQSGGKVSSISVYVASQNRATSLIAGIYSNSNGNPGSLLTSGKLSSVKAGAWNAVSVTSTTLTSGKYWIGLLGRGGVLYFKDRSGGTCLSENSSQTSATSLSSTWPAGGPTWASCPLSAYVTGTATVAGTGGGGTGTTTTTTTTTPTTPTTTTTTTTTTPTTTTTTTVIPPVLRPVNATAPTVSGNATDGQTVSTSNGTWLDAPSTYAYQWQDCNSSGASCTTISGATASSYKLTDSDIGKTVRSVVTAGNSAGSAAAASAPTSAVAAPPAPADTVAPSISGSTVQGQSLTTTNGSWSGNPTMISYQWQDCDSSGSSCSTIAGATGSRYTLGSGDVGHTVRSVVTAGNAGGSSSASSAASAVVTAPVSAPSNTAVPAVSGTTTQGQAVTTSKGSWSGTSPSYAYQWQDCNTFGTGCSTISGATSSSYTLQAGDIGDTVRSVVTASNSAGSASASSTPTSAVAAPSGGGTGGGTGGGGSSSYTCTQHVTTSSFASAYSSAGAGAVLCLAPGSYGSFNATNKSSMVVITPDVSAGATAPTGNATGDVNGNVTFSGANFASDSDTTMDGVTFTDDVDMSGSTHDITLHDSLFHQHLIIDDTSMTNANIHVDYNMFPGDKADCINGPEGRIWPHDESHSATPDGVVIENNNIGGATSQCDGIQFGGYGAQIVNNWIHDFHYAGSAHTDGIQDYGGRYEVVKGNFMYNTPDCYVSYDGTNHADVEDNICVNDGSQSNGASPNDLDILGDIGSIIKHNTVVAFNDTYNNAGGCITLGAKSGKSTGTVITDNIATCMVSDSGGVSASYSDSHNMWVSSGPSGSGDLRSTPTYAGGSCASLSSSQSPFCSDGWSNYMLAASAAGNNAADDGTDIGAYGPGPVTPGGPA